MGPPVAGVALAIVLVRVVRLEGVKVPTRVSRICPLNNFFPPCRCCNPSAAQRAMHAALFSPTIPSPGLFLRVPLSRPRPLDSTRWICCQSCKRVANPLSLRRSLLTSAAISGTGATRTLIIFFHPVAAATHQQHRGQCTEHCSLPPFPVLACFCVFLYQGLAHWIVHVGYVASPVSG